MMIPKTQSFNPDSNILCSLESESVFCDYVNKSQFNYIFRNIQKPYSNIFSTMHLNIRSPIKSFDQIFYFLSALHHEFSLLAITETWLNHYLASLYNI